MNALKILVTISGLAMGSNLYANGDEVIANTVLLDGEGVPLCRIADGFRVNPEFIGEDMLPESRLSEYDIADGETLVTCHKLDVIGAIMDARGEEVHPAVEPITYILSVKLFEFFGYPNIR